jgi:glutamate-1-semialdehyde 2,1-aminomutase
VAYGGAQELYGIKADITCLGKIIGGGLPLAAVGGQAQIMDMLAPTGPVYQAGTLSGNPVATAAANATLDILARDDCYGKLEVKAAMLADGLKDAAGVAGIPIVVNRVGSILSCFFTDRPVCNFEDVQSTNIRQFKKFFASMLSNEIYIAPSAYEAMFVSLAHSKKDIDKTIEAAKTAFKAVD